MGFAKKLFIVSVIVLSISICTLKYFQLNKKEYLMIHGLGLVMKSILFMDSVLKYVHISGLYRSCENLASSTIYSRLNRSGLIIDSRLFDGVEVLIFDPIPQEKNKPAILYMHGGGWVLLNPRIYSSFTAELARRLNVMVVSINYRKAPEHRFPAGVNDAIVAVKYFFSNAETFNVNPNRIALMGDSAGGNLVVAVAYKLRTLRRMDKRIRVPKIIVPLCPSLQMADNRFPSMRSESIKGNGIAILVCFYAFGDLCKSDLEECVQLVSSNSHLDEATVKKVQPNVDWSQYLTGHGYENRPSSFFKYVPSRFQQNLSNLVTDPLFSPLSALNDTELAQLPPVYLLAGSLDPLKDDAKLLAARLSSIGHHYQYTEFPHFHVSFLLAGLGYPKSDAAFEELIGIFMKNAIL